MSLVCSVAYTTDHIFPLSARFAAIHLSVPRGALGLVVSFLLPITSLH